MQLGFFYDVFPPFWKSFVNLYKICIRSEKKYIYLRYLKTGLNINLHCTSRFEKNTRFACKKIGKVYFAIKTCILRTYFLCYDGCFTCKHKSTRKLNSFYTEMYLTIHVNVYSLQIQIFYFKTFLYINLAPCQIPLFQVNRK